MDGYDKRQLRSYLSCQEHLLKTNTDQLAEWRKKEDAATDPLDKDIAAKMIRWCEGMVTARQSAINDFKEQFAEELEEGGE